MVFLGLHYIVSSWQARKFILLLGSYLFYAAWNPPFVVLLWISTIIDWIAAHRIYASTRKQQRIMWLVISLMVNLGMLIFFKYGNFLLENFTALMNAIGVVYVPPAWDIFLPIGISFYTFQTLSYTIDVYRGELKPGKSFLDYALYVTFFPQLVAGPIVRAMTFLPQCVQPKRASLNQLMWGLFLMTLGLFQKIVLADGFLAGSSDFIYGFSGALNPLDAWIGVLAFSSQIFCDFAGYSTCAIGVALCFGFYLPDNFRAPYAAIGLSDFWRRWHISLSTWLRDYLYISLLGGNRMGAVRTVVNLMLTMLIGGLWHGASWTFVAWGGLHGIYLIVEHGLRSRFGDQKWVQTLPAQFTFGLFTFLLVSVTWVFFRSADFPSAWRLLGSLFGLNEGGVQLLKTIDILKVLIITIGLLTVHWLLRNVRLEQAIERLPSAFVTFIWAGMLLAIILTQGGGDAFIYFQF